MPENSAVEVAIGLGANLGNPVANLAAAVAGLLASGLRECRRSRLYETLPVDCQPGTPNFINAVVVGRWAAGLPELLDVCKRLEAELGRPVIHSSSEARTVDLDLVLANGVTLTTDRLRLPHPHLRRRLFVLLPLRELVPDWRVPPDGATVAALAADLLAGCPGPPPVWLLGQAWPADEQVY